MLYPELKQRMRLDPKSFLVETVNSVQYLEELSTLTRANLESWDLSVFIDRAKYTESKEFVIRYDKNRINQIFWEQMEARKKAVLIAPEIDTILQEDIIRLQTETLQNIHETEILNSQHYINQANTEYAKVANSLRIANTHRLKAEKLIGRHRNLKERLGAIHELGSWQYVGATGAVVIFQLTQDVILTYKNDPTKEHYRVNLGSFRAELDIVAAALHVKAIKPVLFNGYYHPHLNQKGQVCWGTAISSVTNRLIEGDYKTVFSVLYSILTNYNQNSPYVTIQQLQSIQPNSKPGWLPELCKGCEKPQEDCECCENCEKLKSECHCETCPVCERMYENGLECDCCQECERIGEECEACSVCSHHGNCACCQRCERSVCISVPCPVQSCGEMLGHDCWEAHCKDCMNHDESCECPHSTELERANSSVQWRDYRDEQNRLRSTNGTQEEVESRSETLPTATVIQEESSENEPF